MMKKFFALVLMLMTLLISSTTFAFSVFHPADGIYSLQPQCAPGKELSVENHGTNWGANVIIDNINSGWRKWKIQRIEGSDFYSIIAVHSNLALDVANARAEDGVNIATWPFLNDKQNRFRFLDAGNGYYVIQADIGGNFVVDVFNRENRAGTNVWSYGFNGTPAQLWRLVKVQNLSTFQSYSKKATQKVTAYVMPNLQARSGNEYVSAGDNVTVLREEGNAYLVRYPVRNDTKTRWVDKREIFKGSNDRIVMQSTHDPQGRIEQVDSPSPGVLHVRGTAHDPDNHLGSTRLHVYVGGNAGSGAPGYEIRTDGNSRIFDDTRKVDRTGKQHVYIYALNDYGSGNNVEIWNGYVNIQGNTPIPSTKLQSLINEWEGKTWSNHYYSPNGIECKEFAAFVYNKLYGLTYSDVGSTNGNKYTLNYNSNRIGCRASQSNLTTSNVRTLYQNAQPGDFIQMRRNHGGAHSAILVSKDDNGVTWFEANTDGANGIRKYRYTYDELVNGVRKGNKVYWVNVAMSIYYAK